VCGKDIPRLEFKLVRDVRGREGALADVGLSEQAKSQFYWRHAHIREECIETCLHERNQWPNNIVPRVQELNVKVNTQVASKETLLLRSQRMRAATELAAAALWEVERKRRDAAERDAWRRGGQREGSK